MFLKSIFLLFSKFFNESIISALRFLTAEVKRSFGRTFTFKVVSNRRLLNLEVDGCVFYENLSNFHYLTSSYYTMNSASSIFHSLISKIFWQKVFLLTFCILTKIMLLDSFDEMT